MRCIVKARLLAGAMAITGIMVPNAVSAQTETGQTTTAPATTPDATPPAAAPAAQSDAQTPDQAGVGGSGKAAGDIVVVGNRYQATNLQMRSDNTVNVLSAQDLAHTAVHNVAEALGLLPGINVMNTGSAFIGGADGASRGEGMFVSVRGLNSEYNINQINGVDVAQGNPYSRGVQLSLLPPSGLQTIILNKTSRADMDGDAIGGTVDFHTPSAFDYSGRYNASLTGGGRLESRARDYGKNGLGYSVAGDMSAKFGAAEQFGVYVSAFYDVRHFANSLVGGVQESGCCDLGYDFAVQGAGTANQRKNSAPGVDPINNLILTGVNYGVSSGFTERFGGNASFDWHPDDDTAIYLRGTYAQANTRQDSHLSQVVGDNKLEGSDGTPLGNGTYAPVIQNISTRFWYETNPERATLGTLQLGASKRIGKLTLEPNIFFSWGRNDRPNHIEVAARTLGSDGNGLAYGGSSMFTYSQGFPYATLTAAQNAALRDIANMPAAGGAPELTVQRSGQVRGGMKMDAKYDVGDDWFSYIKTGFKFQDSSRTVTNRDYTVSSYGNATTFGQLGLISGTYANVFPGKYSQSVPEIDQTALFNLFQKLGGATDATIDTCGSGTAIDAINSYNCNTQKATEFVAAGYVEAALRFGNLEVTPGFRFEHTEIHNVYWVTPTVYGVTQEGYFSNNAVSYDEALPSLFLNYRPSSNAVYRAAVWTSYVGPPFLQLGGGSSTSVSQNGNLTVRTTTIGNPKLKPITSLNIDASGEWDFTRTTHASLAGFYKRLRNYIYDAGSNAGVISPSGTTADITYQPQNGGTGKVYGIEASFRQKLSMLPGIFSGLGFGGNLTRQWTQVDLFGDRTRIERIQNAPDWMGNAQLFFEKGPVSFDLNYDYSSSYVQIYDALNFGQYNLNQKADDLWVRPVGRLDLHAGFTVNTHIKIDASVSNVLGSYSYWSHIGEHSLTISDIVDSGSTSLLTATIKF